jgi:hypothetical protein
LSHRTGRAENRRIRDAVPLTAANQSAKKTKNSTTHTGAILHSASEIPPSGRQPSTARLCVFIHPNPAGATHPKFLPASNGSFRYPPRDGVNYLQILLLLELS